MTYPDEWDLTVLIKDTEDPVIEERLRESKQIADEIEKNYKGKIHELDPKGIAELIDKRESMDLMLADIRQYASLSISANANNTEALKLMNRLQVHSSGLSKQLTFMYLELGKLLDKYPEFIDNAVLSERMYFLQKIARSHQYRLSETEEQIILEKNLYGINEWQKLQGQWLSKKKFKMTIKGEDVEHSWSSGHSLLTSEDHEVRLEAVNKLFGGLREDADIYASALRNVCATYVTEAKRRGYPSYMETAMMASNIEQEMWEAMVTVVEENVELYQEFLQIKAKILGTEKLRGEDLYAPLPFADTRKISWDDALEMVRSGYAEFDSEFGEIVEDMAKNARIDSRTRPGKRAGAFCSTNFRMKSAFIMQSFAGTMSNVGTLAHELGHAVHAYLTTRNNKLYNLHAGMSLAESASEFGTMLFTEKFLGEAPDDTAKKAILFDALEGLMTSIFEVSSRTRIEQKLYEAIDNGELLTPERINQAFWEGRKIYFGDVVDWIDDQAYEWCWKPHYYIPGLRFYNFPYVFGELLVLALYNAYKKEGDSFVPKFKSYLAAGGSKPAKDLAAEFGFDFSDKAFWQQGVDEMKRMMDELKTLL